MSTETEDYKLVSLNDINKEEKIVTDWDNGDKLIYVKENIEKLKKMKFNNFSDAVLNLALYEVLYNAGGWVDYDMFDKHIQSILDGNVVPFSMLTNDKITGNRDFWLVRSVVNVKREPEFVITSDDGEEKKYNKKTVLMSKQFLDYLRKYCKEVLKDRVQFWIFSSNLNGQQYLDMNKFCTNDRLLLNSRGDNNPDEILMFQFKKKVPEVMVGRK